MPVTSTSRSGGSSGSVHRTVISWVSDASGNASGSSGDIGGALLRGVHVPGAGGDQPTDLYDVTIADEYGVQLHSNTAISNAAASHFVFDVDGSGIPPVLLGPVTITVANAGNAKSGQIIILSR